MAIKAGRIITQGNGFLLERLQTSGPGSLNIPSETIKETGNDLNVAVLRDIPDLSFDLESFDMTCELEAVLCGYDPTTLTGSEVFEFTGAQPLDVNSPYKSKSLTNFHSVAGAGVPYLLLNQVAYKFQAGQSSSVSATLGGDSVYYAASTPRVQVFGPTGSGGAGPYAFGETPAIATTEHGDTFYAWSVTLLFTDGSYKRLFHGSGDYTDTNAGFTLTAETAALVDADPTCKIRAMYASATDEDFPQSVHSTSSVKPGAVKGRTINVYVSDGAATPTWTRWPGIQSADVSWKVTMQNSDELGNPHHTDQDYDTPELTGTISYRPSAALDMINWINRVTATPNGEAANATSDTPIPTEIQVNSDAGVRLKTLYCPDIRYTLPSVQAKVGSMTDLSLPFQSDTGAFKVYNGVGPSGL